MPEDKLTPEQVTQRLKQNQYEKNRQRFLSNMDDMYGPRDWQFDAGRKIHFMDDGEMYDGDEQGRMFVLIEIQPAQGPGFSHFPNMGYLLFVRGQRIASDVSLERLKGVALQLLGEDPEGIPLEDSPLKVESIGELEPVATPEKPDEATEKNPKEKIKPAKKKTVITNTKQCPQCNGEVVKQAKICKHCGSSVDKKPTLLEKVWPFKGKGKKE